MEKQSETLQIETGGMASLLAKLIIPMTVLSNKETCKAAQAFEQACTIPLTHGDGSHRNNGKNDNRELESSSRQACLVLYTLSWPPDCSG